MHGILVEVIKWGHFLGWNHVRAFIQGSGVAFLHSTCMGGVAIFLVGMENKSCMCYHVLLQNTSHTPVFVANHLNCLPPEPPKRSLGFGSLFLVFSTRCYRCYCYYQLMQCFLFPLSMYVLIYFDMGQCLLSIFPSASIFPPQHIHGGGGCRQHNFF